MNSYPSHTLDAATALLITAIVIAAALPLFGAAPVLLLIGAFLFGAFSLYVMVLYMGHQTRLLLSDMDIVQFKLLANKAGVRALIIPIKSLKAGAMALGVGPRYAIIAINPDLLTWDGGRGVFAHELGHAHHFDAVMNVCLALLAGLVSVGVTRLAGMMLRPGVFESVVVLAYISVGSALLAMWLYARFRQRAEFRADSFAVQLVGKDPVLEALQMMDKQRRLPAHVLYRAFSVHPSTQERINRIMMTS